jgi:hypothetical protein
MYYTYCEACLLDDSVNESVVNPDQQLAEGLEFSFAWRLRWPRNAVKLAGSG